MRILKRRVGIGHDPVQRSAIRHEPDPNSENDKETISIDF